MSAHQSEVTVLKNQVVSFKRDLEAIKTKYNETSEKLMEKTRQYQKLQVSNFLLISIFSFNETFLYNHFIRRVYTKHSEGKFSLTLILFCFIFVLS